MKSKYEYDHKHKLKNLQFFSFKGNFKHEWWSAFLRFRNLKNDKFQPSDQNSTRWCQSITKSMNANSWHIASWCLWSNSIYECTCPISYIVPKSKGNWIYLSTHLQFFWQSANLQQAKMKMKKYFVLRF